MVKIERFLTNVFERLMYSSDLDLKTAKWLIREFRSCLSPREIERNLISIDMILTIASQQISLIDVNNELKTAKLENELNNLKEGN